MKISPRLLLLLLAFTGVLFTACESTPEASTEWRAFEGEVVYIPKYQGYWGIKARGIGRINPMSLPTEFQHDGMQIAGEVLMRPDVASAKSWGTVGEVRNLRALE